MYDSIDIRNNKNLYSLDKLDKLNVSQKELLYNAILLYYILYNKFDKSHKKLPKVVNNVVINNIYSAQEEEYKTLYNELLSKVKDLEDKCSKSDDVTVKKLQEELVDVKTQLNEANTNKNIDQLNSNIDTHNKNIEEYNNVLKEKNELSNHVSYLTNLVKKLQSQASNNNTEIIKQYKKDLEDKQDLLNKLKDRINELNDILREYILKNNKYLEERNILTRQLDSLQIYMDQNDAKIESLQKILNKYELKEKDLKYKKMIIMMMMIMMIMMMIRVLEK